MVMASFIQPPLPAAASNALLKGKLSKSWRASHTLATSGGGVKSPSLYLQLCSRETVNTGTRRVGFRFVGRCSTDTEEDAETEHVRLTELDIGDGLPRRVELVRLTEVKKKSSLAKLMAKVQLLGVIVALGMVLGARMAAAAVTGSPVDGKKRSCTLSACSVSSSAVRTDDPDRRARELSAADMPESEEADCHGKVEDDIFKCSMAGGVENCRGKIQRDRTQKHGVAVAAGIDGTDEEARQEYEQWKATPYALTVPLRLVGLRGSVPPVWLKDFSSSQGKRVKVVAEFQGNLQSIFTELSAAVVGQQQITPKSALAADLVTVGDSWLGKAVSRGLINPIENVEKYEWFQRLGTRWQTFLRRNHLGDVDPDGKVYAVPYRWGSVVIAYNRKKIKQHGIPAIQDWEDLWRPELAGKIAMISSPRDVIGAVLKSLGASYNVRDFETDVPGGRQAVKEKFDKLLQQVRVFDSVQYLKILGAGEVWVAVGWSGDVIPFAKRTSNISVTTPQSGTSLWADLWAIPATPPSSRKVGGRVRGPSPLIHQWLDFCLQWTRANSFKGDVIVGASPLALSGKSAVENSRADIRDGADNAVTKTNDNIIEADEEKASSDPRESLLHSHDPLQRNEFLEPLSPTALEDFRWLLSRGPGLTKTQFLADKFKNVLSSRKMIDS